MVSLSYAFTPYTIAKETVLRPMLPVTLKKSSMEFPTMLLVDAGADYSMIRRDIVQDGFEVDISTLKDGGETSGVTGKTKVAWINIKVILIQKNQHFEEDIPFQVSLEPEKDTPLSILGRIPFFLQIQGRLQNGIYN